MNETSSDCLVVWEGREEPVLDWSWTVDAQADPAEGVRVRHARVPGEEPLSLRRTRLLADSEEPFVCFVPPGADVAPDDVVAGVRELRQDTDSSVVVVGRTAEAKERVTFFGLAWGDGQRRAKREVLSSAGAAAVFRRADLAAIGGFDGSLEDAAAELDVGWKLWMAGGRVHALVTDAPDADESTGAGGTERAQRSISERELADAIKVAWRCFDDERAAAALAGGLLVAPLLLEPGEAEKVLRELSDDAARTGDARSRVQQARVRSDAELLHLFSDPLEVPGLDEHALSQLADDLSLRDLFGARRRVLVVTGDVVGPGMAGPAIRAWHMAECLGEEHDVVLATTSGHSTGEGAGFRLESPDSARFEQLMAWCDIVVVQGYVLLHVPVLRRPDKIMVVDVYDILHLEALELSKRVTDGSRDEHVRASLHALNDQASRGDYFICASEKQRDYWVGHLSAMGRVNAGTYGHDPLLRSLVDVVPFGLPAGSPERNGPGPRASIPGIGPDDDVLLWAGGIYDWLDPTTLVRAVDRLRHRRPQVRLVFMGMRHPNPEVPVMAMAQEARRVAQSLGIEGTHVFFNDGWVEYDSRQNWLLDADIGVSTHFEHAETAFAFRTRLLDYLWAGLPVVATEGDAFADLIQREGLGRVVGPQDVEGLEEALYELLSDKAATAACKENVARVRRSFEWPTTLAPLLRFCRAPSRAADNIAKPPRRASADGTIARFKRRTRTAAALYAEGGAHAVWRATRQRLRQLTAPVRPAGAGSRNRGS